MTIERPLPLTERLGADTPLIEGWHVWWTLHGQTGETVIWNARLKYNPSGEVLHADTPDELADKTRAYEADHPGEIAEAVKGATPGGYDAP